MSSLHVRIDKDLEKILRARLDVANKNTTHVTTLSDLVRGELEFAHKYTVWEVLH